MPKEKSVEKTNVMRLMDARGISYKAHEYDDRITDGEEVARAVGKPADEVFKTLVTVGASKKNYVFVIPVSCTLDLKKAAKAAGDKSIAMILQKELLPLTGYVHGGCSPVGMKKQFPTFIDETAELFDTICVSAGKRGAQLELEPRSLMEAVGGKACALT